MFPAANLVLAHADYFILIMFRVSGLVISSPIFGRVNVPNMAKIGLSLSLGFMFFIRFPQVENIYYATLMGFILLCAAELLLGMALAYVTNIFFSMTAFTAGQLIDMQIGFGIVNVFDAQNQTQVPMMGNLLNIMMLILFFLVNGHLRLIEIVHITIDAMPIGSLVISYAIGLAALEVFIRSFLLGIMMALPILASGLTLEIGFGMMMRAVPQIHMFVVGIPLKMLVGLIVFSFSLPVFAGFTDRIFTELFLGIELMFGAFAEGAAVDQP
ncbi:MAG: flagellar biosynthetic protein FliR [Oscillospiraceae bacterium]|nr:flagellar biosynthetic protein FliR [Oscillospiraceae bacterium]MCL2278266.1 flagellar biosynthetic protein FliR [Oscillospiraceae bacterium]